MTHVTLGDVHVSALSGITWAMTSGTAPYTTNFEVNHRDWDAIKDMMGEPQVLKVQSMNGEVEVRDVYPLYEVGSSSRNRRRFIAADKRWLWPYKIIIRDYNMTRKTGRRTMLADQRIDVPIELVQYVDKYTYLGYSLDRGNRAWRGTRLLEDVLSMLSDDSRWQITSIPIVDTESEEGLLSIQNLMLRDPGHMALERALRHVPGAEVTVLLDGMVDVFDGTDIGDTDEAMERLSEFAIAGEFPRRIDKSAVNPSKVKVYVVREIEARYDYEVNEAPGATVTPDDPDDPLMWNVLPLPDPITEKVGVYDEDGNREEVDCPAGTWVRVNEALKAWERDRLARKEDGEIVSPFPYTFETIRKLWGPANIDAAAKTFEVDFSTDSNEFSRWNEIKRHFRTTFQLNPRYMNRIREIRAVRAALLDPFTGTRSPAMAWSQYCIVPTQKGIRVEFRGEDGKTPKNVIFNVDQYPGFSGELYDRVASQATVSVVDGQLGILRVNYAAGPYGLQGAFIPSMCANSKSGRIQALHRALREQDDHPIAFGAKVHTEAGALWLAYQFGMCLVVTITMNSPNTKRQMQEVVVTANDLAPDLVSQFGIKEGKGPAIEVFIPPSVCTARYAWDQTQEARQTLRDLFGVASDNDQPGLEEGVPMSGYLPVNLRDEVYGNAKAAALEILQSYADVWMGTPTTILDPESRPKGSMNTVTHEVAPSPGGSVRTKHTFTGQPKPIDRYAFLPETVRHLTLGILPYKTDGSNA